MSLGARFYLLLDAKMVAWPAICEVCVLKTLIVKYIKTHQGSRCATVSDMARYIWSLSQFSLA